MDPALLVSPTALDRLEQFSDQFAGALALAPVDSWAERLGFWQTSDNLVTRWPIAIDAAGYHEFQGDMKFRTLYGRETSLRTRTWQDGVEVDEAKLRDPWFVGWQKAPQNMALEWTRLPNLLVAAMLEANPYLGLYDEPDSETRNATYRLFHAAHLFNLLRPAIGTFNNIHTTTVAKIRSGEFFKDISVHFDNMKGPNGQPMNLSMAGGEFLVHPTKRELFKEALTNDTIIRAISNAGAPDATSNVVAAVTQNNIYKGTMGYTSCPEFSSGRSEYFYAIAADKPGLEIWVGQKEGSPTEIRHDYESELYKRHLKLGVASVGRANCGPLFPHRIVEVQITG